MPLPVDKLTKDSPMSAIRGAVNESIKMCMNEAIPEGYDVTEKNKNKWCAGKCYGIAREKTGKDLKSG